MHRVRKAVIPAAGLGTRLLPITRTQPKEMLPVLNMPAIHYIVEEALASGIEEILIVTSQRKLVVEEYFNQMPELERLLALAGKRDALSKVQRVSGAEIKYVRQPSPRGLGDAILCARTFVGDEPFVVLLGDDVVRAEEPCIRQLLRVYEGLGGSVIAVEEVAPEKVNQYGIIDGEKIGSRTYVLRDIIEKPVIGTAPSCLAVMGRYVLEPGIFAFLESQAPGLNGEIQLTDALQRMNQQQPFYAHECDSVRFDLGDLVGWLQANVEFALCDPVLRDRTWQMLQGQLRIRTEVGGGA